MGGPEAGLHGLIFYEYAGDWRGALRRLATEKTGEAPGALLHPKLPPTDLVFGKEGANHGAGYGVAKLIKWHPEVLDKLGEIFAGLPIVTEGPNRVELDDGFLPRCRPKGFRRFVKTLVTDGFQKTMKK